jgi:hypothetical protein
MSHKGHEDKRYGVPCQKIGISFFQPLLQLCFFSAADSCKRQSADLKMRGCSSQFGAVGVHTPYFQWTWHYPIIQPTTHLPLPHSINLCAYPQHMTMTHIYEFHTRTWLWDNIGFRQQNLIKFVNIYYCYPKLNRGQAAISKLNSILWDCNVTVKTKTRIYQAIVKSTLTYAAET